MTAVEWLMEQITYDNGFGERQASFIETVDLLPFFEQAKELERKQIEDAVTYGNRLDVYDATETIAKDYYTKTYQK